MMALAVVFFTCIDTSAKWLILSGLPTLQVVFMRYLGHFTFSACVYLPSEGLDVFRSDSPRKQLLRSFFLLASTVCNFAALKYLPITVTTTITFAGPVAITLLAIPILKERVGIHRMLAVCAGFGGVVVVMQPWGAEFHPAMFFSLAALLNAALYFIMTRMLAGIEGSSTQQMWASGLATVAMVPFVISGWVWPDNLLQWTVFIVIGAFGALGHISATTAHRWADASILSPIIYIQIFFAAIAGVLVFNTWPTVWTFGGGSIIVASGIYIWIRERKARA